MNLQKNDIVTRDLRNQASNAFYIDSVESETVLLTHPLASGVLIRVPKNELNTVNANLKDSTERCIDFAHANKSFLDYNTIQDLECIGIFFFMKRLLTPRQKQVLANVCGIIASIKFNNDLKEAINFVSKNSSVLDEFNLMWYNNFRGLFTGKQPITSKKQRGAIFNIAGYVLAELEIPSTRK